MKSENDWNLARAFARDLHEQGASKEINKVHAFLCRRKKLGNQAGKQLDQLLDRLSSSDLFSHTQNTRSYFAAIRSARREHLKGIDDGERLAEIIGWAKRLAPAFSKVQSVSSLAPEQRSYSGSDVQQPQVNAQLKKLEALFQSADGTAAGDVAPSAPAEPVPDARKPVEPMLKVNDIIDVTVERVTDGKTKNCVGTYQSFEIRFDWQYGRHVGMTYEVKLLSENAGVWKAKCIKKK